MKRRPLCIFCVLFLTVQAIRVLFFGAGDYTSALGQIVNRNNKGEINLILTGTADRIDEKESVTAVRVKGNAVSFYSGSDRKIARQSVFGKSDGHRSSYDFSQELPRKIWEEKVLVYLEKEDAAHIKIGNKLKIKGKASAFETARNPGNFDQRAYYKRQKIGAYVWADEVGILSGQTECIRQFLHEFRQGWKKLLVGCLGSYYGNTISAILLGEKGDLDPYMKKLYQNNGIGHLLAISGLHMSFIGSGLYGFLRKRGVGFPVSGAVGTIVLLFYTVMTGASISALRALIMFSVRMGAEVTGRDCDLPTSLAVAAALLSAKDPLCLSDAGFLFSFGSLCGICMLTPLFECLFGCGTEKKNIWTHMGKAVSASLAVNLFLLGPMLYFYFEIPPYSVFLNLFVIPALPVIMGTGLSGSVMILLVKPIGIILLKSSGVILWAYDRLCSAAVMLPFGRITAGKPSVQLLVAYYVILFALYGMYRRFPKKIWGYMLFVSAAFLIVLCGAKTRDIEGIKITVLDVGQGDGIVLSGKGKNYLIDGGSSDVKQAGAQRIEPYLLSEGIGCLDYVFVTHGDEDHISGIRELLEGQKLGVRIDTLVLPPEEYHDEKLADLARIAVENGTRVVSVKTGANIYGRGERQTEKNDSKEVMRLRCIGPLTDIPQGLTKPKAGNEASLVLEFSYGNFDMLFTGDVEGAGEELLVKSDVLRKYEILKCAHHGSKNSGTAAFLEKTDPRAAIISAGIDNRYGHPHEETLNRLKKRKVKTYNTQTDGAVTIKSDGIQISIESFLLSK